MNLSGDNFEALCADLDRALGALAAPFERDPALWPRVLRGRWTAGGHAAHIAASMERSLGALEAAFDLLQTGTLGPPPRRGLLSRLFVKIAVQGGRMPRGARTPAHFEPGAVPPRAEVFARCARAAARTREIGLRLAPRDRDRLWIRNPFHPAWHYRLPELVRAHAVHARHHAAIVEEMARV